MIMSTTKRELSLQTPYMRGDDVKEAQTMLTAPGANALLEEFIAFLHQQVANHSIYVWGAQGQGGSTITEDWIQRKEASASNADRAIRFWKKQVASGYGDVLRAFDCSGLGMYWLQNLKGISKGDMSSNTMMQKCKTIAKNDLKRGDWVFRTYTSGSNKGKAYHIGYVVDDALGVIEAKGRDDGVVKRTLAASGSSYWNAFGRPEAFFSGTDGSGAPTGGTEGEADAAPVFAQCSGGSVNIRSGPGTQHAALGTAKKGEKLLAMPAKDGWREVAAVIGGKLTLGYISNNYVEVRNIAD